MEYGHDSPLTNQIYLCHETSKTLATVGRTERRLIYCQLRALDNLHISYQMSKTLSNNSRAGVLSQSEVSVSTWVRYNQIFGLLSALIYKLFVVLSFSFTNSKLIPPNDLVL
jgi:hypothetical protein